MRRLTKQSVKTETAGPRMKRNAMPATRKLAVRAAKVNNAPRQKEIVMSIDLGSSGVRSCIWNPDVVEGQDPVILILNRENGGDGYNFSASGAVMDNDTPDEEIYINNLEPESRLGVPLKYGLYILSNAPEALTNEYHLMEDLIQEDHCNREEFRRKLRLGLVQIFTKLKGKVEQVIEGKRKPWKVGRLCITIPSKWTLDFEDQYRSILAEVFEWDIAEAGERVTFVFEPEGLAAYLLHSKEYKDDAIAQSGPNEHRIVLGIYSGGTRVVLRGHPTLLGHPN
ncbi:hypothetical protein QR685DRAFT_547965 [Neurospora intermedia]|uniref:Uncharacterized protein n=1 Tax=Neurospora intermedia TaxID=5142 RepID=A0ABR3D130_NEUIN